jgi:hypothetical protein
VYGDADGADAADCYYFVHVMLYIIVYIVIRASCVVDSHSVIVYHIILQHFRTVCNRGWVSNRVLIRSDINACVCIWT